MGLPVVQYNIIEPYISRLRGEFSKQVPDPVVRSPDGTNDPEQVELVENHLRYICEDSCRTANDLFREQMSGYSVFKIWTEYRNELSYDQVIRFGKVDNPTLCGFDINAKEKSKGDGDISFEVIPKTREKFEEEFGTDILNQITFYPYSDKAFQWAYSKSENEVICICELFYKKRVKKNVVQLSRPFPGETDTVMVDTDYEEKLENFDNQMTAEVPPAVLDTSSRNFDEIWRYRFVGNTLIDQPMRTEYPGHPS